MKPIKLGISAFLFCCGLAILAAFIRNGGMFTWIGACIDFALSSALLVLAVESKSNP